MPLSKALALLLIVLSTMTIFSQEKNTQDTAITIINKTFIAKIGSVCEETPDDNPCAGYEIFLELNFTKKNSAVLEKEISSCDKESIREKLNYKWELLPNTEVKIHWDLEDFSYPEFVSGLTLKLEKETLVGYKKYTERILFKQLK